MAYANYLASVEWTEVESLRKGLKATLAAETIVSVSHLLPGAVKQQPLGGCFATIIDGGEILSPSFWHPLRVPVVHSPQAISGLTKNLLAALENLDSASKSRFGVDYEITSVLRVLNDAATNNRGLISVLEPPADEERAQRVRCPFSEPEQLPIPWGNLGKTLKRGRKPR
jgi:hypothetical protein